jgi:hypothetical protein
VRSSALLGGANDGPRTVVVLPEMQGNARVVLMPTVGGLQS